MQDERPRPLRSALVIAALSLAGCTDTDASVVCNAYAQALATCANAPPPSCTAVNACVASLQTLRPDLVAALRACHRDATLCSTPAAYTACALRAFHAAQTSASYTRFASAICAACPAYVASADGDACAAAFAAPYDGNIEPPFLDVRLVAFERDDLVGPVTNCLQAAVDCPTAFACLPSSAHTPDAGPACTVDDR